MLPDNRAALLTKVILYAAFLVEQVFNPTIAYKGQKLTRLVSIKTAPNITNTSPNVPGIVPVK